MVQDQSLCIPFGLYAPLIQLDILAARLKTSLGNLLTSDKKLRRDSVRLQVGTRDFGSVLSGLLYISRSTGASEVLKKEGACQGRYLEYSKDE